MAEVSTDQDSSERAGPLDSMAWAWRALLKRWPIVVALMLLGAGVALAYSQTLPRIYEAATLIEFDPDAVKPLGGRSEQRSWSSILDTHEYYETQYKIIQSDRTLSTVVRDLALQNDPEFLGYMPAKPLSAEDAVLVLRGRLIVDPLKGSRLVYIRVRHTKPAQARRLSEAIARTYISENLEKTISATGDAVVWLSGQLEHFKQELEQTENSLHEFKKQNDLPSSTLEDLSKMIRLEMQEYDNALTHTRLRRQELVARESELAKIQPENPDQIPASELLSNAYLAQLRKQYQDALRERAELVAEGKGENHPSVKRAEEKVALAKAQLVSEVAVIKGAVARDVAIIRQQENGEAGLYESSRKQAVELNLKELEFHRLDRMRAQNEKLYATLLDQLKETDLRRMMNTNNIRLVDTPFEPRVPVSPHVTTNVLVGIGIGILFGCILALIRDAMDNTLKTPEDVEKQLQMPFLGLLPELDERARTQDRGDKRSRRSRRKTGELPQELYVHEDPGSSMAEAARSIRTNLLFMNPDKPYRKILVTSALPSEGKTTVAVSIAISLAQSGLRVCIIDCDLRRPRLHRIFGRQGDVGIVNVLVGEAKIEEAIQPTVVPNLSCIPCGVVPPSSADVVASERFRAFLEDVASRFDRVVIDSPPAVAVTDSAILSTLVDGVVMVARAFRTTPRLSKTGLRKLRDVEAPIAGVVLNAVNLAKHQYYYEGYYYYRRDQNHPATTSTPTSPSNNDAPPAAPPN